MNDWTAYTQVPPPGSTPEDHLRHTLDHYQGEGDGVFVILATRGVYGAGVTTGLTWGDLARLQGLINGLRRELAEARGELAEDDSA